LRPYIRTPSLRPDFGEITLRALGCIERLRKNGTASEVGMPSRSRARLGWAGSFRGYLVGADGTEGCAGATLGTSAPDCA